MPYHQVHAVEALIGKSWSVIRRQARDFSKQLPSNAFALAKKWYQHSAWEVRYFAVLVLGALAQRHTRAVEFLYASCGNDPSWQVNEALAMAFDDYCASTGYEAALPIIRQWLHAPSANVRRAVSEGLRPWTASKRGYFAAHPRMAVEMLGVLKDDPSRSVQESVGNALRDISRKHPDLVLATLREWLNRKPESTARRTIAKFALERAVKEDEALRQIFEDSHATSKT
jgi:3-methyladenine DNA glycosylase AlkC